MKLPRGVIPKDVEDAALLARNDSDLEAGLNDAASALWRAAAQVEATISVLAKHGFLVLSREMDDEVTRLRGVSDRLALVSAEMHLGETLAHELAP